MFRGEPKETNYQSNKVPEHWSIGIYLPRCEPVYLDVAIEISLVPNLDRFKQSARIPIAQSFTPIFANSNKPHIDRGVSHCSNISKAVCSKGCVAQMLNKIVERQATANQT